MSSNIYYENESLWVSNARFRTLIEFALEVGEKCTVSPEEKELVQKLREEADTILFNGCEFDLNERFATVASRKFWARVFFEVSRRIFLRQIGNQETDSWQTSAICDTHWIGRILVRAVQKVEMGWYP
jgi:hypothetical protein